MYINVWKLPLYLVPCIAIVHLYTNYNASQQCIGSIYTCSSSTQMYVVSCNKACEVPSWESCFFQVCDDLHGPVWLEWGIWIWSLGGCSHGGKSVFGMMITITDMLINVFLPKCIKLESWRIVNHILLIMVKDLRCMALHSICVCDIVKLWKRVLQMAC